MKDEIFKQPVRKFFEFDDSVASVFDDMVGRSVPFYGVCQELIAQILSKMLHKNAKVVDLGCSTASTLLKIFEKRKDLGLFGYDSADAMIEIARAKARAYGADINFKICDITTSKLIKNDATLLNYTLQFIRPIKRSDFIKKIYENLNDNGIFIFSEKLIFENKKLSKNMIEIYENYKEDQGYSKFEISQKRQALENVLIPYTYDENRNLVAQNGFRDFECIFKWANFATFITFK